ncbi:proteinase B [Exophiala xenobiotica]|uniref:Proteinase B n=1 Tax=Lithohypha guttulata TaxID=1690604 RepID=A0ABR0K281_9EURO|nr:proteinase B [Lithohypha guttulata]KAK5315999.1 proteinase B [Exophiala xenobiotica]
MRSVISLALAAVAASSPVLIDTIHNDAAPIHSSSNSEPIANNYMIVFKDHVTDAGAKAHQSWVQDVHEKQVMKTELKKRDQISFQEEIYQGLKHTYSMPGLMGYSGHFDEDTIEQVRRHPDVEYIELDSEVHTMKEEEPDVEKNAPWGLARISHRKGLSFSTFNKYLHTAEGGEGVTAYVIDTGTNVDHVDFEGRAKWGKTIPQGDPDEDGNGHGTHCSGTVAGKKFGVAKKAHVKAVKVLRSNGSGSMSDVVKGVEWAATDHKKNEGKKGNKGSVANMSLGGGKSPTLDLAVNAAVDAGIHFAVAAGNDNANSCNYSPAAAAKAVTVGASTLGDERAYFSNFGKCTDIFAPGLNIQSTWIGSKYATNTISGTSMASPHICGLLAYYLSLQPSSDSAYAVADISPKKLKAQMIGVATKNILSEIPSDTVNLLAWNGGGKSNFSDIINEGAYDAKSESTPDFLEVAKTELKSELKDIVAELESLIGSA